MPPKKVKIAYRTYYVTLSDARCRYVFTTNEMSYVEAKYIYDKLHLCENEGCRLYLKENAYDEDDDLCIDGENIEYKDCD